MYQNRSQPDNSLQSDVTHIVYNMCPDVLDQSLACGMAKMALSLLQQQQDIIDTKKNVHESIFQAVLVLMRCLSDYDDIVNFSDHEKNDIYAFCAKSIL